MLGYKSTRVYYDYTFLDGKEHARIKVAPGVPIPERGEEFFIHIDVDTAIAIGKDEKYYRAKFSKQTKDGVFIYAIAIDESEVTQDTSTQNAINATEKEPELFNFSGKIGVEPYPFALAFQKLYGRKEIQQL